MYILFTGGAGYIGSHTLVAALEHGNNVFVLDNLCNSSIESVRRVEKITGKSVAFIEGDIRDSFVLDRIFTEHAINARPPATMSLTGYARSSASNTV